MSSVSRNLKEDDISKSSFLFDPQNICVSTENISFADFKHSNARSIPVFYWWLSIQFLKSVSHSSKDQCQFQGILVHSLSLSKFRWMKQRGKLLYSSASNTQWPNYIDLHVLGDIRKGILPPVVGVLASHQISFNILLLSLLLYTLGRLHQWAQLCFLSLSLLLINHQDMLGKI